MPKLCRASGQEAIRVLERLGFEKIRQRGSHVVPKKQASEGAVGCVVPLHRELGDWHLAGHSAASQSNTRRVYGEPLVNVCRMSDNTVYALRFAQPNAYSTSQTRKTLEARATVNRENCVER